MGFRRLAGVVLLLACMAAYWLHFEKRFAALEAETALQDPDGQLTATDRERLLALRAALQRDFGVTARLVVRKPDDTGLPPALSADILYVAVTPQTGAAEVLLPALLARALTTADDPNPEQSLVRQLGSCVRRKAVGDCLQTALVDMLVTLEPRSEASAADADPQTVAPPASAVRRPLRMTPPSVTPPSETSPPETRSPAMSSADAPPAENPHFSDPRTPNAH